MEIEKSKQPVQEDITEFGRTLDELDLVNVIKAGREWAKDIGAVEGSYKAQYLLNPGTGVYSIDEAYSTLKAWSQNGCVAFTDDNCDDLEELWAERVGAALLYRNPTITELIKMYLEYAHGEPSRERAFLAWLDRIREFASTKELPGPSAFTVWLERMRTFALGGTGKESIMSITRNAKVVCPTCHR